MKKLLMFLLTVCFIVPCSFFLAACGGNKNPNNNGDNQGNSNNGNSWIQYYDYKLEYFVDEEIYYTVNKIPSNANVELPAPPTKEGYVFAGWDVEEQWGNAELSRYANDTSSDYFTISYNSWENPVTCDQKAHARWIVDDGMYFTAVNPATYAGKKLDFCYWVYGEDRIENNVYGSLINHYHTLKRSVVSVDLSYILDINEGLTMEIYYMPDGRYDKTYQDGTLCDIYNVPIDPEKDYCEYYVVIKNQSQETKIFELIIQRNALLNYKFYNVKELVYDFTCESDEKIIAPTETNYSNGEDGYTFKGWTTTPGSDQLIDFNNYYSWETVFYAVYTNNAEHEELFEASCNYDTMNIELYFNYAATAPENLTIPAFFYTHPVNSFNSQGNSSLINVTLPSSIEPVKNIFQGCNNLKSVTFERAFTELPEYIFSECPSLETVNLPDTLTTIGEYAFNNCIGLKTLSLSNTLETISDYAFNGCESLESLELSNTLTTIGDYAFYGCESIDNLTFPDSLTSVGNYAFAECSSLTSAILPRELDNLGEYVFKNCSGLINVELPDNCPEVAFILYGANNVQTLRANFDILTSHYLFIKDAFTDGGIPYSLKKLIIAGESVLDITSNNAISNKNANVKEVVITNSVKELQDNFYHWPTIEKITFEEGVELDELSLFDTNLTPLDNMPKVIKTLSSLILSDDITEVPFNKLTHLTTLGGITSNTITEVIFPENSQITEIRSFKNVANLKKVILPKKLATISIFCFDGCNGLEEITIPASVTTIDKYAFRGCYNLKTITLIEDNITHIGQYAFAEADLPLTGFFKKVVSIDDYAFFDCGLKVADENKHFIFPSTLKTIGDFAFKQASFSAANQVEFPATIESIGTGAFNVGNASFPFTSHNVDYFIFNSLLNDPSDRSNVAHYVRGNKGVIFKNISSMPDYCFAGLEIKGVLDFSGCTFKTFGDYAFYGAKFTNAELAELEFIYPDSMTQLGDYAFKDSELIQDSLKQYPSSAFVMPQNVTVYDNAFGAIDYNNCYGALSGSDFKELTVPYLTPYSLGYLFGGTDKIYESLKDGSLQLTILGKNKSNLDFSLYNVFNEVDFSAADFDVISNKFFENTTLLEYVVIPTDFVIPDGFFDKCVNLKSVSRK